MDSDMGKCHIIAIFDARNRTDNYKKIKGTLEGKKLENKDDFYSREDFETILRKIGLDVILIACQRNGLDRHNGKHNSLSESTENPEKLIKIGYINALEFQRPNVEGILRNNLKVIPEQVTLVMGSDCHDWKAYPNHDEINGNSEFKYSRANILPTFKGLLMAVTSPETRINQQESKNVDFINEFCIRDKKIPLVNGINAIIGENGSGKSTLLKLLNGNTKSPKYVKKIIDENHMKCENLNSAKQLFIGQGDIVSKFDKNELFSNDNFNELDDSKFRDMYKKYATKIMECINKNIKTKEAIDKLTKKEIEYSELTKSSTYYIHVDKDSKYADINNEHESYIKELKELIENVDSIVNEDYFKKYKNELNEVINTLNTIHSDIEKKYNEIELEKQIKNIILSELNDYDKNVLLASSSNDKDKKDFLDKRESFIADIINASAKRSQCIDFPVEPNIIQGVTKKTNCGYSFNSEANYHDKNVAEEFFLKMFVQDYSGFEEIKNINSEKVFISAIRNCGIANKIEECYEKNLRNFLDEMCKCSKYIVDISVENQTIGNTLGELSLAYFKYETEYENDKCVFLIDQPEDHISNNNISRKLLTYFNSIRNKKQIIIVTHNPLLVVNQDVDNVIFVNKDNNKINIASGCLEYEDDTMNMLDLIADKMDGGRKAIEKRLKVYGKEN